MEMGDVGREGEGVNRLALNDADKENCRLYVELLMDKPDQARDYLTGISSEACEEATEAYWNLGDLLWAKYDEKW